MRRWNELLLVAAVLCAGACGCHEKSVKSGINDPYRDADVDKWVARFESESREIYQHREKIVAAVNLPRGATIADVGAGTGFLTRMFAEAVGPDGKVFAVDITEGFLEMIRERMADAGINNVQTVRCKEDSVTLPPDSTDVVFVCDTYHHFEFPRSTLASIHQSLRTGGQLIVIDFERIPGVTREWIMGHVRAGKKLVIKEISAAGFKLVEEVDAPFLEQNYMLRFQKVK